MKNRILVIGDIHGRVKALREVLKKCNFDYYKDTLICLGDVCDGGYNTYECVEELLKIKKLIYIMGNHDEWFLDHIKTGWSGSIWTSQGGMNTIKSYITNQEKDLFELFSEPHYPVTHQELFNNAKYYYEFRGMLFVHGGINPKIPKITSQSKHDLVWDRDLIQYYRSGKAVRQYKKIFIGHTPTENIGSGSDKPIIYDNEDHKELICMDTGAGWTGKLSIMDIKTEEFWQSEKQEPAR